MHQTNTSKQYRGVTIARGSWQAQISVRGRSYWLGSFPTAEEAAQAYDDALAYLASFRQGLDNTKNFPDRSSGDISERVMEITNFCAARTQSSAHDLRIVGKASRMARARIKTYQDNPSLETRAQAIHSVEKLLDALKDAPTS